MDGPWGPTLIGVGVVSALSLVGATTLAVRAAILERGLLLLVSFAAGALLGNAFLHLIPEVVENSGGLKASISLAVLGGIVAFFLLEKALHWHHAHFPSEEVLHPVAVTNLIGDGLHNLLDGVGIAAAFLASTQTGVATVIAVALHEIPQELGDFGILVHAGMPARRALAVNFLSALTAVVGAVLTLVLAEPVAGASEVLVPFVAGSFIYIGSTDLLPELHKEPEAGKSVLQTAGLLAGIAVMALLLRFE
jgi:zinc and cadmium transporter